MTTGPGADHDARLRAEFRAFVREHHPDRGGDPAAFVAGLARFRADRAAADRAMTDHAMTDHVGPDPADARYDAPIEFVTPYPLPLRVAIALIRTVRRQRHNRVR